MAVNYQAISSNIAPDDGNCTAPQPLAGAQPGTKIVAWTLVTLPSVYLDVNGLSRVKVCIGGSQNSALRLRDGMTWSAPRDPNGRVIPETGGLFLLGDSNMASIKGFEFYVEYPPREDS